MPLGILAAAPSLEPALFLLSWRTLTHLTQLTFLLCDFPWSLCPPLTYRVHLALTTLDPAHQGQPRDPLPCVPFPLMLLNSLIKYLLSRACQGSYVLITIIRYIVYWTLCISYFASTFHTFTPVILTATPGRLWSPFYKRGKGPRVVKKLSSFHIDYVWQNQDSNPKVVSIVIKETEVPILRSCVRERLPLWSWGQLHGGSVD